jgi:hypothetical protein
VSWVPATLDELELIWDAALVDPVRVEPSRRDAFRVVKRQKGRV